MRKRGAIAGLFVLLAGPTWATVYFQDEGTKTGWDNYPQDPENLGRIDVVSSPTYKGNTALRFEQTYDADWSAQGRGYHAEVVKFGAQRLGEDKYYGGAMYLPSNWNVIDKNTTFWQFSPESPSGPWNLNWVQLNEIRIRVMGTHYTLATISPGVWNRCVARFKLSSTSGAFQYWVNGTLRRTVTGNIVPPSGAQTIRWSVGIYVTWWRDATDPGGPATRYLYQDHHRITSSYSEAEPANWGGSPTPTPTPCSTCGFSGYYRITPRHSGKAVVVQSASTANAANVIQWSYGGSNTNDEWELRSIGSGYYRVINRASGKDLTVQSASTAEGANIFQYTYGGTATNDEWAIVSVGSGYYRITNRNSGKSAEVAAGSTGDGANVDQRTYGGATYQQFQLVSVP
jgi:predicted nucleic acid-binding Zn ribbon protein